MPDEGLTWFLRNSNTTGVADVVFAFGNDTDFPIVGDWDNDGMDTPGVVRGNVRYLRNSNTTGLADLTPVAFGNVDDFPMVWSAAPQ